jgi:hypothetical protein
MENKPIFKSYYTYSDIFGAFFLSILTSIYPLVIIIKNENIAISIGIIISILFCFIYMYNFYKIVLVFDDRFQLYYPISKKTVDYYPSDIKKVELLYSLKRGILFKVYTNKFFFTFQMDDKRKRDQIIELAKSLGITTVRSV